MDRRLPAALSCLLLMACASACVSASFKVTRDTETSGRFVSDARSWTVISYDIPKDAELIARENISDARLANAKIEQIYRSPDWVWWFRWFPEIFWSPTCRIIGTWGFPPVEATDADATPGSSPGS